MWAGLWLGAKWTECALGTLAANLGPKLAPIWSPFGRPVAPKGREWEAARMVAANKLPASSYACSYNDKFKYI